MFEKKRRCVWQKRRATGGVFACVLVHTLVHSPAFPGETNALHIGVRTAFIQVFARTVIFFFVQKNLLVQNGVQNGVQNRVQIRGPKGGQRFVNTHKIYVTCTRMSQLSLSIYLSVMSVCLPVCLSVCLSVYLSCLSRKSK